jgi:membrane protein
MIGVVVAGTAYQLLQAFYISIQIKLSSYGAVYGSFAALPLFLIWLNLSWMIILAGVELAYQLEISCWSNVPKNEDYLKTTTSKRVLALLVVHEIIEAFREGKSPLTLQNLSDKLGASKNNIDSVLKTLIQFNIISEIFDSYDESHYQPAKDVNRLSLKSIADIFPYADNDIVAVIKNPQLDYFTGALNKYDLDTYKSVANISLG